MRSKAKTFCYISLGVLALAAAYHLGARSAGASYVPPGEQGVIASSLGTVPEGRFLLDNGQVWVLDPASGWRPAPACDLPPVPVSDIKFWEYYTLVTKANEGWAIYGGTLEWTNWGPCPGLTTAESSTWGKVKAKFGK